MSLLSDLQKYQSKRKFPDWTPKANDGVKQLTHSLEEALVFRCLEFVDLEVQVGEWVKEACLGVELEIVPILLRNVADEQKHDASIRHLRDYYGSKTTDVRAFVLASHWANLKCSPVVAAYALEMGVFFTILPILMKYGDVYASSVASWINDDERVHVETNLRLMKHYGLKLTDEVILLVYNTVAYIFQSLGEERAEAEGLRAIKRLTTTKDPQMLLESLPVTISYFEQNTNQDIVYT